MRISGKVHPRSFVLGLSMRIEMTATTAMTAAALIRKIFAKSLCSVAKFLRYSARATITTVGLVA